jgi:hypothetical protein
MRVAPVDRSGRVLFLESQVNQRSLGVQRALADPHARRHLGEGFGRRFMMMQESRLYLEEHCSAGRSEPLDTYEAITVSIHLNAYYLNLRGALDNLAWALKYRHAIIPEAQEETVKHRGKVKLFGKEFIAQLEPVDARLASRLRALKAWFDSFTSLRDPAAHRIPLYAPPGVITTQAQMDEFKRLDELAGRPESELGGERRIEIMRRAHRVGRYAPVMVMSSLDGLQLRPLGRQLMADHRRFLGLSRWAIRCLERPVESGDNPEPS